MTPGIGGWRRDRASASFSVVQMNAQQMVPSEYWRGPGRRPAHRPVITTGAMRPPERDAEASTTLRRGWA
jgi:hypothetical protein